MQIIFGHFEKETYLLSWVFDKKISTNLMSPANLKPANIRMTFISHFSNVHVRKLFCNVRQRLLFQVYWILLLTSVGPLSTGYLQDGAKSWAKSKVSSRSVDLEQKCPELLTDSFQNVRIDKDCRADSSGYTYTLTHSSQSFYQSQSHILPRTKLFTIKQDTNLTKIKTNQL